MKHYKSPSKIKEQMEFWYYKSHRMGGVDKKSIFILYQLLGEEARSVINSKVELKQGELIVYVLYNNEEYIINTTERFIKITNQIVEEISYVDFNYISLDKLTLRQTKKIKRIDTEYTDCYLFGKKDEMITWPIPTKVVNSFIQNTKRCELIGRKYL